ncbi:MAG: HEAT repeat domain-containing protein [Planctomycetota bacterium]
MSRRRLIILAAGCCVMLTCEAPNDAPLNSTADKQAVSPAAGTYDLTEVCRVPADWARRALTDAKRVDPPLARLAVSRVTTPDDRPLLRLDTVVIGSRHWPTAVLSHCGLEVRRQDPYVLVESRQPGGLRTALRDAMTPLNDAIDRLRHNLMTQHVVGQRAMSGGLERLIARSTAATVAEDHDDTCLVLDQGGLVETHRALDLAIDGNGLFVIEFPGEDPPVRLYTRDGRFTLGRDGTLVSVALPQARLVPEIVIPPDTKQVAVSPSGRVQVRSDEWATLSDRGALTLVWFEHPEYLEPLQPGFYARSPRAGALLEGQAAKDDFGRLVQGHIEGSNVSMIEGWAQLCLVEDARQIVLAMLEELNPGTPALANAATARGNGGSSNGPHDTPSPTVCVELSEASNLNLEPTLLRFLRIKGVDVWVEPGRAEVRRSPETAVALVEYLTFLRTCLNVIAENIANADALAQTEDGLKPYRRRFVVLRDDGSAGIVEDASPLRAIWEVPEGARHDPGQAGVQLVQLPNVDTDRELAHADALSREYRAIREALHTMGADAVPALAAVVREPSSDMRLDATWALGQIGPDAIAAVPTLIEALSADNLELRKGVTDALHKIAPRSDIVTDALVSNWTTELKSLDDRERAEAVVALGHIGARAAAAVPDLMNLIEDPTSGAAQALGRMGPAAAEAVPALTDALQHSEPHVRQLAADALGRIGPPARSAVPALVRSLDDENAEVRWRAATAVGMIGAHDSGSIQALAALLHDQDAQLRDRVAEALGRLGHPSEDIQAALGVAARSQTPRDRVWPLFALALVGKTPAASVVSLTTCLLHEQEARIAACHAIARLGPLGASAIPLLMEQATGPDERVAAAAIEAIGAMGSAARAAVPVLSIALDHPDPFIRKRAADALGQIGEASAAAVPALVAHLGDESEQVVLSAVQALGEIGPRASESAQSLQSLRDHGSVSVRSAVVMALDRLAEQTGDTNPAREDDTPRAVAGSPEEIGEF